MSFLCSCFLGTDVFLVSSEVATTLETVQGSESISHCFCCVQVLATVGHQEAESRFQKLLTCLTHPPSYTCVRASTHLASLDEIKHKLGEELRNVSLCLRAEKKEGLKYIYKYI